MKVGGDEKVNPMESRGYGMNESYKEGMLAVKIDVGHKPGARPTTVCRATGAC
jgi:hypothetical protein